MSFYTGTIILSELLMLAMSLHMLNYTGFTKQQKAWFLMTFLPSCFARRRNTPCTAVPTAPPLRSR